MLELLATGAAGPAQDREQSLEGSQAPRWPMLSGRCMVSSVLMLALQSSLCWAQLVDRGHGNMTAATVAAAGGASVWLVSVARALLGMVARWAQAQIVTAQVHDLLHHRQAQAQMISHPPLQCPTIPAPSRWPGTHWMQRFMRLKKAFQRMSTMPDIPYQIGADQSRTCT